MIEEAVKLIDAYLIDKTNNERFVRINYGLCKLIDQAAGQNTPLIRFPAVVGEVKKLKAALTDKASIITYHRLLNTTFDEVDQYGESGNDKVVNHDMMMIVWADLNRLKISESALHMLMSSLPSAINLLKVDNAEIQVESLNTNSSALYAQEYEGAQDLRKPDHAFFAVLYQLQLQYNAACVSVCEEC